MWQVASGVREALQGGSFEDSIRGLQHDGGNEALYIGPHFALPNSSRSPFRDWLETAAKARNVELPWKLGESRVVLSLSSTSTLR